MASEQNGNGAAHVEADVQLRSTEHRDSLIRRSWHAILSPFSPSALASLPNVQRPARHLRADNIPETESNDAHERPTVRDYHSINSLPPNVHVPKKIPTTVKVEGKVWFANERTWISWLSISVLIAALSLGLFNASKDDIARNFAYVYAFISVCVLIYGYALYQHRISMIRRRDPGHFDALAGPILLSIALFTAVLANFVIRGTHMIFCNLDIPPLSTFVLYLLDPVLDPSFFAVRELQKKDIPIPGAELFAFLFANTPFANKTAAPSFLQQPL